MRRRIRVLLGLVAFGAGATTAHAETARQVESCTDALYAPMLNAMCVGAWQDPAGCDAAYPVYTSQCWDFELGLGDTGFGAWAASGDAFANQPVYGDNIEARRATAAQVSGLVTARTVLADLDGIGGDYWNVAYPIGHQGDRWIGTFEHRPRPEDPWGGTQGESPTGTMISPTFIVTRDFISFLIGGTCDLNQLSVRLEVQGRRGRWGAAVDPLARPLVATGACSELLERRVFFTDAASNLRGRLVRLVVTDAAAGGHISVDHILHTDRFPDDFDGANRPLWGFADTHAHPGNHQSFQAFGQSGHGLDGDPFDSSGAVAAPHLTCDGGQHGVANHDGGVTLSHTAETASFGMSPRMPEGCYQGAPATHFGSTCLYYDESPSFAVQGPYHSTSNAAPYWYTRTHQQMYRAWIERAYQGGQRLMIASAGNNELMGAVLRFWYTDQYVSDYGAMRRFAAFMKDLDSQTPWMEIALTPADARRIVRANKLAIVLSTEVDDIGDHCTLDLASTSGANDGGVTTTTTPGHNPFNMVKVSTSCASPAQWAARIENLYQVGYRMLTPIHFANNALGGAAIYTEMHNTVNRFANRVFFSVAPSYRVGFRLGEGYRLWDEHSATNFGTLPDLTAASHTTEIGWCSQGGCTTAQGSGGFMFLGPIGALLLDLLHAQATPVPLDNVSALPPYHTNEGHINAQGLTTQGRAVIAEMKARGMIIDVAHMSERGRESVLGTGYVASTASLIADCDLNSVSCQESAYPVIASHAGLRNLALDDHERHARNEGALSDVMIERIRAVGGTVAIGTSGGDTQDATAATPPTDHTGETWRGIFTQRVVNNCAGSSKTFAQGYLYALRAMRGKGITLGTDINGFEGQINPRFGTLGCYARGTVPRILQWAHDNTLLIDQDHVATVHPRGSIPFNYDDGKLASAGWVGTAGGQRWVQRESVRFDAGLNYRYYNGVPPVGAAALSAPGATPVAGRKFYGLWDPVGYDAAMLARNWNHPQLTRLDSTSMRALMPLPPMQESSQPDGRRFDFNYDGLAHYGMLPDLLQDARGVGMSAEQLAPLFQGAEAVVDAWEKGCRLSDPSKSALGCQ